MIDRAVPGMTEAMSSRSRVLLSSAVIMIVAYPAVACSSGGDEASPPKLEEPSLDDAITTRFPVPGSTTCADASLRMTFASAPTLGTAGKIRVLDADAPDMPAVEIDLGGMFFSGLIGGKLLQLGKPVFIDGNDVVVYLAGPVLNPGHTYYVTVDQGVFLDAEGKSLGKISDPAAWRFTAVAPAPASPSELTVALDGTGDYCSVQGAIDAVPAANASRVTITVRPGVYREIVEILNKQFVTLRGEDRDTSIIAYTNNDDLNGGTHSRPMVNAENSNDLVIENITLHNTTPQGGSQAEALRVEPGERVILRNANFLSLQDTLLLSGHVYVTGAYVEGNVDYVWGKGTVFFDDSELRTVGRFGYNVHARNLAGQYGYVFVNSRLTADDGITGQFLGRIDVSEYPGSMVAYVDCEMTPAINVAGWTITPPGVEVPADLRFWEYGSVDPDGNPVDVSRRAPFSKQLTDEEAEPLRDPVTVLGFDPNG
jgi:pectin methylesterase-like acyl-CoA thioesterase